MNQDLRTISGWVESAAMHLVHRNSLDDIEKLLVSEGISGQEALKLVLLIPSAFAREYFEPQGISFPDTFFTGSPGQYTVHPYSSERIYAQARMLARRWLAESRPSLVLRVLDWSAEANTIKQAKEQGLTPGKVGEVHHGF